MAENWRKSDLPSNEEIIEDLARDMRRNLNAVDGVTVEELVMEEVPESEINDDGPCLHRDGSPETDVEFDGLPTSEEATKPDEVYSDDIDETALKDAEMDLTDDEKEQRRVKAEELKVTGNESFKLGHLERSIDRYTEALRICPLQFTQQRAILFCNRSAAKMKMEKYQQAIKDCTKSIELDDKYVKAYIRRAQSLEATEKYDESLVDYNKILEIDPSHPEALKAQTRLPPLIEEKNERLKDEMMGKLKDLGNIILKPFGLSTENFQFEQDPDSKGYKINFKQ